MIQAQVYKDKDEWYFKLEGPRHEMDDLLETLGVHQFRSPSQGGAHPLSTKWAVLIPRKKYDWEKGDAPH